MTPTVRYDRESDAAYIRFSPEADAPAPPWGTAVPGLAFVDDEDEFAEHQVAYGYPDDVITAAQASSDAVIAAVRAGVAPYDGTHERWLTELSRLTAS